MLSYSLLTLGVLSLLVIIPGQNAIVQLTIDSPVVEEDNASVVACATFLGGDTTTVRLRSRDNTAKAGEDYVPVDVDITFTEGDSPTLTCHPIPIIDDDIVEVSESFTVELQGSNVVGNRALLITINPNLDNIDTIKVAFQLPRYSIEEGVGSLEVCLVIEEGSVDSEKTDGVKVGLSPIAGTARAGLDFSDTELEFLFRNGSMVGDTACVSVTIIDDNLIETTEQFQLRLDMTESVSGDENSVLVNIEDNDHTTLMLSPTNTQNLQEANPGDSEASTEICITAEADASLTLERTIIISILPTGGTAGLEDFVLSSNGAIVLTALGVTQCINVTVVNDDVREPNEMVVLKAEPQNPRDEVIGIGEFTIVIMDDGDVNCPTLNDINNGRVILTDRSEGSQAQYMCDNGYVLVGDSSRECGSDGRWSGQQPQCLADCGSPPPPSDQGDVTSTTTYEGSQAEYTCPTTHVLVGMSVVVCQPNGMWSGNAPLCLVLCSNLSSPANGHVTLEGTTEGSVANYSCEQGYRLLGRSQRTCLQNAQWSGTEPRCVDSTNICPELTDPPGGTVVSDGVRAMYSCEDGLELVGTDVRICEEGIWSEEEPTCSGINMLSSLTLILLGVTISLYCLYD